MPPKEGERGADGKATTFMVKLSESRGRGNESPPIL
jgi:hypothetical protein